MEAGPAGLKVQRLLALFAAGWLLLSFPLLSLFEGPRTVWGVPLLPAALFAIWLLWIAALAFLSERGDDDA
jgi:4-amino-4-deoxy-L-arabinose transferase-like glycosyltransferase